MGAQFAHSARPLGERLGAAAGLGGMTYSDPRPTLAARAGADSDAWPFELSLAAAVAARTLWQGRRRTVLNEALHELRRPLQALALAAPAGGSAAARRRSGRGLGADGGRGPGAARSRDQRRDAGGRCGSRWRRGRWPRPRSARWRARAEAAGGSLELCWRAAEAEICADRCEISQALDNLIVNAIEHGGPRIELQRDARRSAGCGSRSSTPGAVRSRRPVASGPRTWLPGSRQAAPRTWPAGGAADGHRPRRRVRPADDRGGDRGAAAVAAAERRGGMSRRGRSLAFLLGGAGRGRRGGRDRRRLRDPRRPRLRRAAAGARRRRGAAQGAGDRPRSRRCGARGAPGPGPFCPARRPRGAGGSAWPGPGGADPGRVLPARLATAAAERRPPRPGAWPGTAAGRDRGQRRRRPRGRRRRPGGAQGSTSSSPPNPAAPAPAAPTSPPRRCRCWRWARAPTAPARVASPPRPSASPAPRRCG